MLDLVYILNIGFKSTDVVLKAEISMFRLSFVVLKSPISRFFGLSDNCFLSPGLYRVGDLDVRMDCR